MQKLYSEKIPGRRREYYTIQPANLSLLERIKKHGFKARIFSSTLYSKKKPKSRTVFSAIKKILALGVIVLILAFLYFLISG